MYFGAQFAYANEIFCGQEGGACNFAGVPPLPAPDDKFQPGWEMSVGVGQLPAKSGSSFSVNTVVLQNVWQAHCGNMTMDVSPGAGKSCYMKQVYSEPETYVQCSGENQICNPQQIPTPVGSPGPISRARISGGDNRFAYFWTAGSFMCQWPSTAGLDPSPGLTKQCQVSTKVVPAVMKADQWTQCGQEGVNCKLPDAQRYLIAFGAQDSWTIREIQSTEPISCNLAVFREDPKPGVGKFCYYKPYPMDRKVVSVTGDWIPIGQNPAGSGRGNFSYSIAVGTSTSRVHTHTDTWKKQVTDSISASFSKGAVSASASQVSVNEQTVVDSTVTSFQTSQLVTEKATCTDSYGMWQWQTTVHESCIEKSLCPPIKANVNITFCTKKPGKPALLF